MKHIKDVNFGGDSAPERIIYYNDITIVLSNVREVKRTDPEGYTEISWIADVDEYSKEEFESVKDSMVTTQITLAEARAITTSYANTIELIEEMK